MLTGMLVNHSLFLILFCTCVVLAAVQIPLTAHQVNRLNLDSTKTQINASYLSVYTISLKLGSPEQEVVVQLDSLIGDFWVAGKDCWSSACRTEFDSYKKHLYDWTKSSTYTEDGRPFEVEFASGKYAKDYVTIGEFVVKSQVFGVANLVANAMFEPIDGVLGIGWNADDSVPNILQGLDSTGLLSKSQLTLWLDKQPRLYPLPNNGLLTIGEIDNKNCKDWNVQPLNSDFYWQFNTDAFKVGKYSEKIQRTAIVSISELFILLGDAELNYVISETGAIFDDFYGAYVVPCKKIPTLPDLIFTINSVDYTVTAYDYVGLIALPGEDLCQLLVNESDDEFFFDTVVFGQPFLRPYCHSFNWKDHTIGLATALRN